MITSSGSASETDDQAQVHAPPDETHGRQKAVYLAVPEPDLREEVEGEGMSKTKISWATHVWNPIVGCSHSGSPGCDNCWAQRMAYRLKKMGRPEYQDVVDDEGHWTGVVKVVNSRLEQPLHWRKPRRVFVCSMSDLFHESVDLSVIHHILAIMELSKSMTFLLLTKRAKRMQAILCNWLYLNGMKELPAHIWPGVSVENPEYNGRVEWLRGIPSRKLWVSVEPCLAPPDLTPFLNDLNLVVCGAESGPNRRPFDVAWAEDLYEQCKAAGTPFFGKQASGLRPGVPLLIHGKEVKEWPES